MTWTAESIAEWDWLQRAIGLSTLLHHVPQIDEPGRLVNECRTVGTSTCGVQTEFMIPGVFSRMGATRCRRCCKLLGIKQGIGSPKNDPELRPWVEARLAKATGVTE